MVIIAIIRYFLLIMISLLSLQRSVTPFHLLVFLVVIGLLLGRVYIAGEGYLDDTDEVDYSLAEQAYEALLRFDLPGCCNYISQTEGKPTEALLKMCVIPFHHGYASALHMPRYSVKGLMPLIVYNLLLSISLLVLFYSVLVRLQFPALHALLGMAGLGILVNFNVYTRHILSYELGLFLQLLALWFLLPLHKLTKRRIALAGLCSAVGFTAYNGYFMFPVILFLFLALSEASCIKDFFNRLVTFATAFVVVIAFYECLFRLGGNSFIMSSITLSETIDQGSHSEGFSFLFKYVAAVEAIWGIVLVGMASVSLVLLLMRRNFGLTEKLFLVSIVAYLLFGFTVFVLHKFVFYGRILHMYFPFLILGALLFLQRLRFTQSFTFVSLVLFLFAAQYMVNLRSLKSIAYPRQVIEAFGVGDTSRKDLTINFFQEMNYAHRYLDIKLYQGLETLPCRLPSGSYDAVNICFFRHSKRSMFQRTYKPYAPGLGTVLFSEPHFMTHPAYLFEYCNKDGREFYLDKKFHISIVKR